MLIQYARRGRLVRTGASLCVLLLGANLAGCSAAATADSDTASAQPEEVRPITRTLPPRVTAPEPIGEPAEPPGDLLDNVLADAAVRSGLPRDVVRLQSAWRVTWNDGSLGCPQPGMTYTQALVPGWRLLVEAGAEILDYRATDQSFFVCEQGKPRPHDGHKKGPSEEGPPKS